MAKKTALTDPENSQFDLVLERDQYDVLFAYALLADSPLPAVIRGEELER